MRCNSWHRGSASHLYQPFVFIHFLSHLLLQIHSLYYRSRLVPVTTFRLWSSRVGGQSFGHCSFSLCIPLRIPSLLSVITRSVKGRPTDLINRNGLLGIHIEALAPSSIIHHCASHTLSFAMGTLGDREYTSTFQGLQSTAITSGVALVFGFTLHETLMRLRRYPEEDKRRANGENVPVRGVEGYSMGYLFRARSYVPWNPSVSGGRRTML